MEYYSPTKEEILPSAIAQVDLEGIMLSEISQRQTNTMRFYHMQNFKNTELIEIESRLGGARGRELGWRNG